MKARVCIPMRLDTEALMAGEKATRGWAPAPAKVPAKLFDPMWKSGGFPFQYIPACRTNVAATIARVRAEIANGERKL